MSTACGINDSGRVGVSSWFDMGKDTRVTAARIIEVATRG